MSIAQLPYLLVVSIFWNIFRKWNHHSKQGWVTNAVKPLPIILITQYTIYLYPSNCLCDYNYPCMFYNRLTVINTRWIWIVSWTVIRIRWAGPVNSRWRPCHVGGARTSINDRTQSWLVVGPPLWKIWVRQLGCLETQLNGKIKHGNQTTNQNQTCNWCEKGTWQHRMTWWAIDDANIVETD